MAEKTEISWCDATWNPWIGCTQVSPGCDNCYAAQQDKFRSWTPEGWGGPRKRTSAENWKLPVKWNARPFYQCLACSARFGFNKSGDVTCPKCAGDRVKLARRRVFCSSLADVFDNQVDPKWRVDLFALIAATPNLDWLLLTKRIGNVAAMLGDYKTVPLLPNIWLGTTIVNQEEADRDIPKLLAVPARVRFLSMEPLLGPVDLRDWLAIEPDRGHGWRVKTKFGESPQLDWIIVGGESGPGARPMHPDWPRSLRDQCDAAGVPLHFKQWGEWAPGRPGDASEAGLWMHANGDTFRPVEGEPFYPAPLSSHVVRIGKKAAGRLLDGVTHDAFPEVRA